VLVLMTQDKQSIDHDVDAWLKEIVVDDCLLIVQLLKKYKKKRKVDK